MRVIVLAILFTASIVISAPTIEVLPTSKPIEKGGVFQIMVWGQVFKLHLSINQAEK